MKNLAMDEISNIGKTKVAFTDHDTIFLLNIITPEDFGLGYAKSEDISAPDSAKEHLQIVYNVLDNDTETNKDKTRLDYV